VSAAESAHTAGSAAANSEPTPPGTGAAGQGTAAGSAAAGPRTLDVVLAIVVVALSIGSVLLVLVPSLELVVVSHDLDIVVNTVATAAAAAVAALAWIRFKEGGQPIMLFQAAAFTVLAASNASFLAIALVGLAPAFGSSAAMPTQTPIYAWWIARFTAAALLVAGGLVALRGSPTPRHPLAVIAIPSLIAFLLIGLAWRFTDQLPLLVPPASVTNLATNPATAHRLLGVTLAGMIAQSSVGVLFLLGAALFHRLQASGGPISFAYLTIGLAIAAFSQLQFVAIPGAYSSLVTTGDILRLAFYMVILLGVDADARVGLRDLRVAHRDLERLRDAELASAATEERSRVAREFHDGLAQTLWYAKLKSGRLATLDGLPAEARELAADVTRAVDAGLAETRQALVALRTGAQGGSLPEMLGRYLDDFGERFGMRVEFESLGEIPRLPVRSEAELVRIVQEALNNVRKHADATLVRVQAQATRERLRLTVRDNGRGFDPNAARIGGYGLQGMTERADLVGAHVSVVSAPQDGTTVAVEIPLERED